MRLNRVFRGKACRAECRCINPSPAIRQSSLLLSFTWQQTTTTPGKSLELTDLSLLRVRNVWFYNQISFRTNWQLVTGASHPVYKWVFQCVLRAWIRFEYIVIYIVIRVNYCIRKTKILEKAHTDRYPLHQVSGFLCNKK